MWIFCKRGILQLILVIVKAKAAVTLAALFTSFSCECASVFISALPLLCDFFLTILNIFVLVCVRVHVRVYLWFIPYLCTGTTHTRLYWQKHTYIKMTAAFCGTTAAWKQKSQCSYDAMLIDYSVRRTRTLFNFFHRSLFLCIRESLLPVCLFFFR